MTHIADSTTTLAQTVPTDAGTSSAKRRRLLDILLAVLMGLALIGLVLFTLFKSADAFVWTTIAIPVVLALVFWILERRTLEPATIGIVVAIVAIACALRALRIPIQGIQMTNWLVILAGLSLGAHAGFLTGALVPLLSNIYLGQGAWTPWQMLAWGLLGALAGWIGRTRASHNRWLMAVISILLSYAYGLVMNLETYLYSVGTKYATGFWAVIGLGLPGDTIGAVTTAVLVAITVPWAIDLIRRTYTRHTAALGSAGK